MSIFLKIIQGLGTRGFFKWMPTETYIKIIWFLTYRKKIDLKNPKTYNEKIQWMKVFDHNDLYTSLVDKIEVKKIVCSKIGDKYIIPTIWEGTKPEDIPYDDLPNKFVIKCTHGSHCNIIVKDKSQINRKKTNRILKKWLKRNWFWYGREWAYKNIKPRIIIEKYMEDSIEKELVDYKIYCFQGEPEVIDICKKRYAKETMHETYFNTKWERLDLHISDHPTDSDIKKPSNLDEMLLVSKKLSEGINSVRVDLYEINGKVYFGELTFYSANGFEKFEPKIWNYTLGEKMILPKK